MDNGCPCGLTCCCLYHTFHRHWLRSSPASVPARAYHLRMSLSHASNAPTNLVRPSTLKSPLHGVAATVPAAAQLLLAAAARRRLHATFPATTTSGRPRMLLADGLSVVTQFFVVVPDTATSDDVAAIVQAASTATEGGNSPLASSLSDALGVPVQTEPPVSQPISQQQVQALVR